MMSYRPNLKNMTTIGIREWAAKTERFFDGYVPRDIESAEPKGACMSFGELFMRMADGQRCLLIKRILPPTHRNGQPLATKAWL